jgi:hypothetical protein
MPPFREPPARRVGSATYTYVERPLPDSSRAVTARLCTAESGPAASQRPSDTSVCNVRASSQLTSWIDLSRMLFGTLLAAALAVLCCNLHFVSEVGEERHHAFHRPMHARLPMLPPNRGSANPRLSSGPHCCLPAREALPRASRRAIF